jgi:Holliday junction resolvasome RuvABC ATP-dependent DNA helicase subunit
MGDGQEACGAFMLRARAALSEAIYGQEESKLQILQFIATRIANPSARGANLLLIGPPGIGKTSLIKGGIAKALGWPCGLSIWARKLLAFLLAYLAPHLILSYWVLSNI